MPDNGSATVESEACVYTVLLGDYEALNEQPVAARSRLRFICFTDHPTLTSTSWEMRRIAPLFACDQVRSQRDIKIRAHAYLPDFARSLYIDNSVILAQPPEALFALAETAPDGLLMPAHSYRDTVLDEFLEVSRLGLDDNARIFEQLNHYLLSVPEVLQTKPFWAAIMLRDHRNPRLRAAMEIWAAHVMRYSRRDQLSLNTALHLGGISAAPLTIDNYNSVFHSWPHIETRDRHATDRKLAATIVPLPGQLRLAEQRLTACEADLQAARRDCETLREAQQVAAAAAEQAQALALQAADAAHAAERQGLADALAAEIARNAEDAARAEGALEELRAAYQAVLNSTAWRATGPLRRAPRALRVGLRASLRLARWALTLRRRGQRA